MTSDLTHLVPWGKMMQLKVTLDTNVVIEGMGGNKASVVACLRKLAEAGRIDIALTSRVVADKDRDSDNNRRETHLREFERYPTIPTLGRYGLSRYDVDFYV
ncbi:MAG: hypothetical protein HW414_1827 [Dehalococcoidia bacterium]|nr:hypothetical protein [Dehalococcoidia bacterium]